MPEEVLGENEVWADSCFYSVACLFWFGDFFSSGDQNCVVREWSTCICHHTKSCCHNGNE